MKLIELVRQAKAGDVEAFGEVCLRFRGLVKKYAFQSHLKSIVQEAEAQGWLEVVQGIRQYDESTGVQFPAYLESRVKYGIWNLFKRERRRWEREIQLDDGGEEGDGLTRLEELDDGTDVGREVELLWLAKELQLAMALLPPRQRWVIWKTVFHNESLTVVAKELGITTQGVYNLRQRGFASLKKSCQRMYRDVRQSLT